MFTDKKLLTLGATALLSLGGGTTAFSFRNITAEQLKNMDAADVANTLSKGVDDLVNIITPLVHDAAAHVGDIVHHMF